MSMIFNAKDLDLNQATGTLPNVASAIISWMIPMIFIGIDKTVVDYKVVETPVDISFMGVWIEEKRDIDMEPHGQRSWRKFSCYSEVGLTLNIDEIICYLNKKYRVVSVEDYRLYGYLHYSLIEDYTEAVQC